MSDRPRCQVCGIAMTYLYTQSKRGWRCQPCEAAREARTAAVIARAQEPPAVPAPGYLSSSLTRRARAAQQHTRRWLREDAHDD